MRSATCLFAAVAAYVLVTVFAIGTPVRAESPSKLLDGVYTDSQAQRGKVAFDADCASCHGPDLAGASGPPLKGDVFLKRWEFKGLNALVGKVFDTMPNGYATNVQESVKVDMVSYILKNNGYPAGKDELTDDLDALQEIPILKKGGALQNTGEVANYSLVQAVGCLAEGANHAWTLTRTAAPIYSTSPAASKPDRIAAAAATPLGSSTFALINATRFKPEALANQKVEVKGLIYRDGTDSQISVSAIQSIGACN